MKLIIITGPSGSGKTTFSNELSTLLNNSLVISTDDYYKTGFTSKILSFFINSYFDKLTSLNIKLLRNDLLKIIENKLINHSYKYNFKKKKITKIDRDFKDIKHLIIEGIFALDVFELISKEEYILIQLNTRKEECFKRILIRDRKERGKIESKIFKEFLIGWQIYQKRILDFKDKNKIKLLTLNGDLNAKSIIEELII